MTLDELKKLCDEATPGPWVAVEEDGLGGVVTNPRITEDKWPRLYYDTLICGGGDCEGYLNADDPNVRFIAAARTYLPLLIEVAEAAKAVNDYDGYVGSAPFDQLEDALAKLTSDKPKE